MRRITLCVGIATTAFVLGVTTNIGVDRFGEFAINALWEVEQLTELQSATSFANVTSRSAGNYFCGYLVVSVPGDGTLYLNREEAGTIVNPAALTARLRTIFALREEFRAYAQPVNLFSRVPEDLRIDTTVYIKAHRSMAAR